MTRLPAGDGSFLCGDCGCTDPACFARRPGARKGEVINRSRCDDCRRRRDREHARARALRRPKRSSLLLPMRHARVALHALLYAPEHARPFALSLAHGLTLEPPVPPTRLVQPRHNQLRQG